MIQRVTTVLASFEIDLSVLDLHPAWFQITETSSAKAFWVYVGIFSMPLITEACSWKHIEKCSSILRQKIIPEEYSSNLLASKGPNYDKEI